MSLLKDTSLELESINCKNTIDFDFLLGEYNHYLFEDYIPFWKKYGSDNEFGGFMCSMEHDGNNINNNKYLWYQGRGLWVHSLLYNNFGDEWNLIIAKKTKDFLLKYGRDKNGYWVQSLDRYGNIIQPYDQSGISGLFVAEGLQEYASITNDSECMDLAIESIKQSFQLYDNPKRYVNQWYVPKSFPGMRIQGFEMVTLILLTQLSQKISLESFDSRLEKTIDVLINKFWNSEFNLNNEILNYNYELLNDENIDFIYLGHAIETLWMILYYAILNKNDTLFSIAAKRFKRHIEVSWDAVYGGFFRAMSVNSSYTYDKVLWLQEEVLIGLMILIEHTNYTWPIQWFIKTYEYVINNYPLKKHGYSLWKIGGDRKATFDPVSIRKENYHHPRHLIYNILSIQRILSKNI